MKSHLWKRTLCCLLTVVLILGNIPVFSFAEELGGLCEHHPVHTPECGYSPAIPGSPCTHVHTQDCYQTVAECVHVHDEACGYSEEAGDASCAHVCSEEYGCFKLVPDCHHVHDESCGYVEAAAEQPCTYDCQDCAEPEEYPSEPEEYPSEPEEDPSDPSEPEVDEAVEAVRALMEALPTLEEVKTMSMEDQAEVYSQVQKAHDAYDALTDDQKAQLPEAEEIFAPLFEYFNSLTAPTSDVLASGTCGDNLTWELTDDGVLTISGSGAMSDGNYAPWYDYRSSIKSVVMDSSLTYIGERAFDLCSNLTDVTIPESVTGIGSFAFARCHSLTGITLPSGLTTLGSNPFGYCNLLTSITIPETNASFRSVDGVLFNKACTEILSVPSGKSGSYSIPESVTGIGSNAFTGCKNLTDVIIPEGVTSIANAAFNYCSGLTGITIPEGVTSISTSVFEGCSGLTGITIPERVTSIGSYAFSRCSSLTSITIPGSVTSIDRYAFGDCSSLTSITFSGDAPTFSSSVFSNVTATVYYPNGNSTWENVAGKSYGGTLTWETYGPASEVASGTCGENLTWVLTSDGVLTINGTGDMYNYSSVSSTPWYSHASSITSLVVTEGVTSIGSYALRATGLKSVSFGNASLSLGNYSFAYCESLTSIDFGTGTIQPGEYVFWGCTALTSVHVPQNVVMNGSYSGIGSGLGMFSSCSNLQTATVDCSYVGPFFFETCSSMTQATFTNPDVQFYYLKNDSGHPFRAGSKPMNVTVVGHLCSQANVLVQKGQRSDITLTFSQIAGDTTQHTEQVLPGTATCTEAGLSEGRVCSVCGYVIKEQTNVEALGHTEETISGKAATCTEDGLTDGKKCSVCGEILEGQRTIPASHNFVDGVCSGCGAIRGSCGADGDNLTYLLTTDGVLTISGSGKMAYYSQDSAPWYSERTRITSVVLTGGVTSIGSCAFYGCSSLTSVTIPDSVTSIKSWAFTDCFSLTDLTIPNGVSSIENSTFSGCSGLTSVTIPDSVTSIETFVFYKCSSLTDLTIPKGVTFIGTNAFYGCSSLTSVNIPDGVTSIEICTFQGCSSLTSISIPEGVTSIGSSAFYECSGLTSVTIPKKKRHLHRRLGFL